MFDKLARIKDLPAIPAVALEVLRLALDPRSSAHDLAAAVERDAALTAGVLKLANSAYYGLRNPVNTVHRAVVALGSQTVCNIALATATISAFRRVPPNSTLDRTTFWRHSLACAIATREILAAKGIRDVATGYVVGLLHDIGKLVLDIGLTDEHRQVLSKASADGDPVWQVERDVLGVTHAEVGGWLLARWNLPAVSTEPIRLHHRAAAPDYQIAGDPILPSLMLADAICHAIDLGGTSDVATTAVPSSLMRAVGLSDGQLNRIVKRTTEELETCCQVMGIGHADSPDDFEKSQGARNIGREAVSRLSEVAIQRDGQNRRLSRQVDHLSFVNDLMLELHKCSDFEAAIQVIAGRLARRCGVLKSACWITPNGQGAITARAVPGQNDLPEVKLFHGPPTEIDHEVSDANRTAQSESIEVGGRARGGLTVVWDPTVASANPASRELAKLVAGIAGIAIERIGLTQHYRQHAEKLSRMHDMLLQAHERLKGMHDEMVQQAKFHALGRLAAGVAHDFNNVLSAILGRVQLAMQHPGAAPLHRDLEVIEQAAINGAEVVQRVQQLAGVGSQPKTPVLLNEVVAGAVELTRYKWEQEAAAHGRHIEVQARYQEGLDRILGNPEELKQAFVNLILNAVDAMPEGGTIEVTTRQDEQTVAVEIRDAGSGIPGEVRERIFDPFFTTKGPKGSGLGLSIVDSVVAQHDGQVHVESQPGVGTAFVLEFPRAPRAVPREEPPAPRAPQAEKQTVLLIEDEEQVRDMMCQVLALDGHDVDGFASGEDALAAFGKSHYNVVFTDLVMGGMNGWEVAERLRQLNDSVKIVLVTGCGRELDLAECHSRGIDHVLHKPFKIKELRECLADCVTAA